MIDHVSGMQRCGKCGRDKIGVGSEQKCLRCDVEPGTSNLRVTADDPGDEKMQQMLAAAGVAAPKIVNKSVDKGLAVPKEAKTQAQQVPAQATPTVVIQQGMPFEDCVREALKIMESLPMPKSIAQFKAVEKIVTQMKQLLPGE